MASTDRINAEGTEDTGSSDFVTLHAPPYPGRSDPYQNTIVSRPHRIFPHYLRGVYSPEELDHFPSLQTDDDDLTTLNWPTPDSNSRDQNHQHTVTPGAHAPEPPQDQLFEVGVCCLGGLLCCTIAVANCLCICCGRGSRGRVSRQN